MVRELDAIYEQGVLRPLEPLALAEHQRVRLTLEEQDSPSSGGGSQAELLWLAQHARSYAGHWVALDRSRLVAHGSTLASVRAAARAAGVDRPLLTHLPDEDESPFAGW